MIKICSKCKEEKDINEFHRDKTKKDGLCSFCKKCKKQYYEENRNIVLDKQKKYRIENREFVLESEKRWREDNKIFIMNSQKEWYEKNKEDKLEYSKQYYEKNRDIVLKQQKKYYEENKEVISKYHEKYNKIYQKNNRLKINQRKQIRRKLDLGYRLHGIISTFIWKGLKFQNSSKKGESILKLLPYTIQELKQHLESQFESWMSWENYGKYEEGKLKWQIDHIIPQSKLPYDSMEHPNFQKCWVLENLRPLEAMENIKKSNKV